MVQLEPLLVSAVDQVSESNHLIPTLILTLALTNALPVSPRLTAAVVND